ncbi:hypothetical protein MLD38_018602 [Melastoma candidum]|uniref:Uncharacterized protein n=1 Tax=Melastoma candidum TaxID=119954 RepID=A0ACB9QVN3_9MYRT|nr:hypothetical protein MLD38_018602 [Melastoma candidum]
MRRDYWESRGVIRGVLADTVARRRWKAPANGGLLEPGRAQMLADEGGAGFGFRREEKGMGRGWRKKSKEGLASFISGRTVRSSTRLSLYALLKNVRRRRRVGVVFFLAVFFFFWAFALVG